MLKLYLADEKDYIITSIPWGTTHDMHMQRLSTIGNWQRKKLKEVEAGDDTSN